MRVMPFLARFGLAAALVTLGASLPRHAAAAPDNTRGMAMMSAFVTSDGGLLVGAGAISATRIGNGHFEVVFDRDVARCFYFPALGAGPVSGSASATVGSEANRVAVVTQMNGQIADNHFGIVVFCNR